MKFLPLIAGIIILALAFTYMIFANLEKSEQKEEIERGEGC